MKVLTVAELQARFPTDATVGAIAERLVCGHNGCASHQGLAEFCQDHAATSETDLANYESRRSAALARDQLASQLGDAVAYDPPTMRS